MTVAFDRLRIAFTLVSLLILGCSGGPESDATADASAKENAGGTTGAVAGEAEPSGPNPKPATWEEIVGVIDLTKFPVMEGAKYVQQNAVGSHFMIPGGDVAQAVEHHKSKLVALGWQPETDPRLWATYPEGAAKPQGAQLNFTKNGQRLYASIGVSGDGNLNCALFHLANIDARRFPKVAGADVKELTPARLTYQTSAKPDAVREQLRAELPKQGWIEYKRPPIRGLPPGMAPEDNEIKFVQGPVAIDGYLMPIEGKLQVMLSVRVLPAPLPILADARNVELQDDPVYVFFVTSTPSDDVLKFMRAELTKTGWTEQGDAAATKEAKFTTRFNGPDKASLRLELLKDKNLSIVQLAPWKD